MTLRDELDAGVRLRAKTAFERGRYFFKARRYEEALSSLDDALAQDPTFLRAVVAKAITLAMMRRLAEAESVAERLVTQNPDYPLSYLAEAEVCQVKGQIGRAREAYEKALALDPRDPTLNYNFACFWAKTGEEEKCRHYLTRALETEPGQNTHAAVDRDFEPYRERPWFQELVAFRRAGGGSGSISPAEPAAAAAADFGRVRAEALIGLGGRFLDKGLYDAALTAYDVALQEDPTAEGAWVGRIVSLSRLRREDEALAAADSFIASRPYCGAAHAARGRVLLDAGREVEAAEEFRTGVELDPDSFFVQYEYAAYWAQTGQEDECRAALERSLVRRPEMKSWVATEVGVARYRDREWFAALVGYGG